MKQILLAGSMVLLQLAVLAQWPQTPFEKSRSSQTTTYKELTRFYNQLDQLSPKLSLRSMGPTDAGYPLQLILFSNDGKFDPAKWHRQQKLVFLINNGIHPGEPDGIDASMLLLRDLCQGKKTIPNNIALAFIPVYNIGGMLNRSAFYRVDQNGPPEFGSRGNSQNLDLNRDFIKADSKEALSFAAIFHLVQPDIFVDNHVSDGADYQHIMTLICSQHNKLGGIMGEFMQQEFEPGLYKLMKAKGYDLIPYVNSFDETPDAGWPEFLESARFSTGYATLWNCYAFMPETHMLKPYQQRVAATYALMECFFQFGATHYQRIINSRLATIKSNLTASSFPLQWKLNPGTFSERLFKGYAAGKKPSEVSALPRLYYDRNQPYEKTVKFYNDYTISKSVDKPRAYILPQGWSKVYDRLKANNVMMQPLLQDTLLQVEAYQIDGYTAAPKPFESHHPNSSVTLHRKTIFQKFRKGDWLILMNQHANRFITEVLEPEAMDSYFVWNFFDAILTQKEGYSDYMFEDSAAAFVARSPQLQQALAKRKAADSLFAKSADAQLNFIYQSSPWYEPNHNLYPIFRLMK
jgi:hypothetical protein